MIDVTLARLIATTYVSTMGDDVETLEWRKATSSHDGYGGDCVELAWRKASFSGAGNDCVEAATCTCGDQRTLVRDTKNRDAGTLTFDQTAWSGLLGYARRG